LNLKGIPNKSEVKTQVGNFIIEEILLRVAEGKSPLKGTPTWKRLGKNFANKFKGGNRTPDLELEGDLLDALISKNRRGDEIEVGIFKASQTGKADGHNNHSGDSNLPLRRFIPDEDEQFYQKITKGIEEIVESNRLPTAPEPQVTEVIASTAGEFGPTSLTLSDILSDT